MINELIKDAEQRMVKTNDVLKKDYASLRAGRATPSLLDNVQVEYYGSMTPLNQVANIQTPEARLLIIQPWDKTIIADIEKAIMKSELGLTPNNDGIVIRLPIPQLTQERRLEIVKQVKKKAEEAKVGIRNIRRDVNDQIKALEKDKEVSEDEAKKSQDNVQKITDKFIKDIDEIASIKEKEIVEL
ncbi:ribosome recycling factor [Desulfonispora thiosulfatigenes DSM 11270]|uniref:Ribosome-recycling factor n=1 Tax=Desulfonispora thiosulfatigenes DSM 11270 TaxID=656914 RepID=A0A1W1VKZ6_DESTI|nr:ribosome recycling factor [Desulfonispora thiosulfatigenes]SMB93998.1 ribosome recycling factor [Desulfonispora thiosulfatigenes DSM 11270]